MKKYIGGNIIKSLYKVLMLGLTLCGAILGSKIDTNASGNPPPHFMVLEPVGLLVELEWRI